ncbi:MAG: FHA domain-containing protein [Mogibacterium sp.]|nr:FHA domain-containing protein [Mogibacterium sp.]
MENNQYGRPVASLSRRDTVLDIPKLPAKLGRNDQTVDLFFFHDSISREHCVFECINRKITVKDLNSTVGTFINGTKLDPGVPYHIEDGDKIKIGKVKFEFSIDYEELARREQENVYARMRDDVRADTAGRTEPQRSKNITVTAREINEYEYDESEVVQIECGLTREEKPLSYTNRLPKTEIEEGLRRAAEKAVQDAAEKKPKIDDAYDKLRAAAVSAKAEEAADNKKTQYIDMSAVEDSADEKAEPVDEATIKAPAVAEGQTLRLTWTDDESGEQKELTIEKFPFLMGRKSDCNDYAILKEGASRRHLHFDKNDNGFFVCDDESTNGVKLNGKKIEAGKDVLIMSGDKVSVAGVTFAVKID